MSNSTLTSNPAIITIDGASGAGKGTLTTRLADTLGYAMLDSGALYRIVGFMANEQGLLDDNSDDTLLEEKLANLTQSLTIHFQKAKQNSEHISVIVNEQDISDFIRTEKVGEYASTVAVFPTVRTALLDLQKNMAVGVKGLVADGRDMGTVVFPNAPLKIYLVASAQARAERRFNQLKNAGKTADYNEVLAQIIARDERDSSRAVAPAKPADDAIVIDSSVLNAEQVFAQVWQLCQERLCQERNLV